MRTPDRPSSHRLGLPGNAALSRLVEVAADDVRVRRAEAQAAVVRRYTDPLWRQILGLGAPRAPAGFREA